jgi:hypothetical protein
MTYSRYERDSRTMAMTSKKPHTCFDSSTTYGKNHNAVATVALVLELGNFRRESIASDYMRPNIDDCTMSRSEAPKKRYRSPLHHQHPRAMHEHARPKSFRDRTVKYISVTAAWPKYPFNLCNLSFPVVNAIQRRLVLSLAMDCGTFHALDPERWSKGEVPLPLYARERVLLARFPGHVMMLLL